MTNDILSEASDAGSVWQDVFKDFIQGVRIISDGFFTTGDYIIYNGGAYQVIEFSIRTTRLKSMVNGDAVTVSNRNITEVTLISDTQYIVIGLSYDTPMAGADRVLSEAVDEISSLEEFSACTYLGFKEYQASTTDYLISVSTSPSVMYSAKCTALRIIRKYLDAGIEIPFNQLDIHHK